MGNEKEKELTNEELRSRLKDSVDDVVESFQSTETGSEERSKEASNVQKVVDALVKFETMESEIEDKVERRRLEEEKNKANAQIEAEKARIPWEKIGIEVISSFGRGLMDHLFFMRSQREILRFEETGSIRSNASRSSSFRFPWSQKK